MSIACMGPEICELEGTVIGAMLMKDGGEWAGKCDILQARDRAWT